MSSKKVFRATVNYAELFNRCPPDQLRNLRLLKEKNRLYKEKLYEIPEEPPKINWDFYKSNVRPEFVSMVEEFEKRYNELKVPYPEDPYSKQIEDLKIQVIEEVCKFKDESDKRIEEYENDIIIKCCQIPIEEMTMEEFCEYCPDIAPDFINRPTFWPHTPGEDLPGYSNPEIVKKMQKEAELAEEQYGHYTAGKLNKHTKKEVSEEQNKQAEPTSKEISKKEEDIASKPKSIEISKKENSEATKTDDGKTKPEAPKTDDGKTKPEASKTDDGKTKPT